MMDVFWLKLFGVPFIIGIFLGFISKSYLNSVIRKRKFDRHMDELFKESQNE